MVVEVGKEHHTCDTPRLGLHNIIERKQYRNYGKEIILPLVPIAIARPLKVTGTGWAWWYGYGIVEPCACSGQCEGVVESWYTLVAFTFASLLLLAWVEPGGFEKGNKERWALMRGYVYAVILIWNPFTRYLFYCSLEVHWWRHRNVGM